HRDAYAERGGGVHGCGHAGHPYGDVCAAGFGLSRDVRARSQPYQIGRASCREREHIWGGHAALNYEGGHGAEGEKQSERMVADGHGGTATQRVTVTINGQKDAPEIGRGTECGWVPERDTAETHTRSGAVAFTDADTLDTHTVTFAPQSSGYLGTFALDPSHI